MDYLPHDDWLKLKAILDVFNDSGVSILTFLLNIIRFSNEFEAKHAELIHEVLDKAGLIFVAFAQHSRSSQATGYWATEFTKEIMKGEVQRLSEKSMGMHFNATHAKAHQISDFASGQLVTRMAASAPHLWSMMQCILTSDPSRKFTGSEREIERKKNVFNLVSNKDLTDRLNHTNEYIIDIENISAYRKHPSDRKSSV